MTNPPWHLGDGGTSVRSLSLQRFGTARETLTSLLTAFWGPYTKRVHLGRLCVLCVVLDEL